MRLFYHNFFFKFFWRPHALSTQGLLGEELLLGAPKYPNLFFCLSIFDHIAPFLPMSRCCRIKSDTGNMLISHYLYDGIADAVTERAAERIRCIGRGGAI